MIDDPVLQQLLAIAGEIAILQGLAQYAVDNGIQSEELQLNMAMMDHSMEQVTELLASRIVSISRIEKLRRSSEYGKSIDEK